MGRLEEPWTVPLGYWLLGTITHPSGGIGVYMVISAEAAQVFPSSWGCCTNRVPVEGVAGLECSNDPRARTTWVSSQVRDAWVAQLCIPKWTGGPAWVTTMVVIAWYWVHNSWYMALRNTCAWPARMCLAMMSSIRSATSFQELEHHAFTMANDSWSALTTSPPWVSGLATTGFGRDRIWLLISLPVCRACICLTSMSVSDTPALSRTGWRAAAHLSKSWAAATVKLQFSCVASSNVLCTTASMSRHVCWNPVIIRSHTSFSPSMMPVNELVWGLPLAWAVVCVNGVTNGSPAGIREGLTPGSWPGSVAGTSPGVTTVELSGGVGEGRPVWCTGLGSGFEAEASGSGVVTSGWGGTGLSWPLSGNWSWLRIPGGMLGSGSGTAAGPCGSGLEPSGLAPLEGLPVSSGTSESDPLEERCRSWRTCLACSSSIRAVVLAQAGLASEALLAVPALLNLFWAFLPRCLRVFLAIVTVLAPYSSRLPSVK